MQEPDYFSNDFIKKLVIELDSNIDDENFGVSELAEAVGMSRSNLLRKVKSITGLSVSVFIRKLRLMRAFAILNAEDLNVSEVSYKVGFGSVSYFIKCFREEYGFPPSETKKQQHANIGISPKGENNATTTKKSTIKPLMIAATLFLAVAIAYFFWPQKKPSLKLEKSIAVLPFINDSNDSSNIHFINGLMESVLIKLQKIEDLRVISRTSVEKYRNSNLSIPEINQELNVSFIIEGSGQKIGDKILLNIQLINANTDEHLWAEQYERKIEDIFALQQEIALKIAEETKAIITPQEKQLINKKPTENLEAYELYLHGLHYFNLRGSENLRRAIVLFEKAIAEDSEFAEAYAQLAITYGFMDMFAMQKRYSDQINTNADKALLYDPKLPQALVAKAQYYINIGEYDLALPHLEKALEYHPNSAFICNMLANFYVNYMPNSDKYLQYALKGASIDVASSDSSTASYTYLHLSNALIQNGFTAEAEYFIDKSLEYLPGNLYSQYLKPFIVYATKYNLEETSRQLATVYQKDTTRMDIMQEVGKMYYQLGNYKEAFKYYLRFYTIRKENNMNLYIHENLKIAFVFSKMGMQKEAEELVADFKKFGETDESIYKHAHLATYYAYIGNSEKSLMHLKQFANQENYHYWVVLFFEIDPIMQQVNNHPGFTAQYKKIKQNFWKRHKNLKQTLVEAGSL